MALLQQPQLVAARDVAPRRLAPEMLRRGLRAVGRLRVAADLDLREGAGVSMQERLGRVMIADAAQHMPLTLFMCSDAPKLGKKR